MAVLVPVVLYGLVASGAAGAAGAAYVPQESDIVVTARLARLQLTLGRDAAGKTTCGLLESSGDPRIDEAVCRDAARCMGRKPVPEAKLTACLDKRKAALLKRWTAARGRAS